MTIDTENLRALLADASRMPLPWRADGVRVYIADGTYVGDHSAAELVVAAVNALPELLDTVERKDAALALAETAHASTCAELATAQQAVVDLLSCKHCGGETDGFCDWRCRACERETPKDGACPGRCLGDGLLQVRQALATAEAERLTLARVLAGNPGDADTSVAFPLARRIVNEGNGDADGLCNAWREREQLARGYIQADTIHRATHGMGVFTVELRKLAELIVAEADADAASEAKAEADAASKEVGRG